MEWLPQALGVPRRIVSATAREPKSVTALIHRKNIWNGYHKLWVFTPDGVRHPAAGAFAIPPEPAHPPTPKPLNPQVQGGRNGNAHEGPEFIAAQVDCHRRNSNAQEDSPSWEPEFAIAQSGGRNERGERKKNHIRSRPTRPNPNPPYHPPHRFSHEWGSACTVATVVGGRSPGT